MMLFMCAQDLHFIWLGLIADLNFVTLKEYTVSPEEYLFKLNQFFLEYHVRPSYLTGIYLVTGPGSFTSSRIVLTIVNTLHFVHKIPLFTVENSDYLPPAELLTEKGLGNPINSKEYAHVFYDRPAHITKPRGDK
jgi:tRNA A37 threonylcarbamoyladenosine modification protein TsaB